MKNKCLMTAVFGFIIWLAGYSQNTIELTFSAGNNGQTMSPDSILIRNLTQNDEVMLYSPENSLTLLITGIDENLVSSNSNFEVMDVFPNPVSGQGVFSLNIPENDEVEVAVTDVSGRQVAFFDGILSSGLHSFSIIPGNASLYFITTRYRGNGKTIKIVSGERANQQVVLRYESFSEDSRLVKNTGIFTEMSFQPGDELLFVGYCGFEESGMADSPVESRDYFFEFATNIACPGVDSLMYEGQWYQTIQVFGQCWMKENLNVGTKIQGSALQTNNGTVEKYCYGNSDAMCDTYGGLYIWDEMMQYTQEPRSQGICPEGWHIPTDAEVSILEGGVDSYYPIGNPVWNTIGLRGTNCGTNIKSTSGWINNGNGTDIFGMTILPTGYWYQFGFFDIGDGCTLYSSSITGGNPVYRGFSFATANILRNLSIWQIGSPVRCIKNI